ncbi:MAG TPA: DUF3127 domain-containing protein [Bacteroidia bacterium]|nr:DUF3127 domain-containing protein [Bacteroidia bacterium]
MSEIKGILKIKSEEQIVTEKFRKREFVITDNTSQYPQHITLQLTQDRCNLIDKFNVGDEIRVQYNLRGREWTSKEGVVKYFNTIEAWKIDSANAPAQNNQAAPMQQAMPATEVSMPAPGDDLPF